MISALSLLSLGTYTFLSLYITLLISLHSSSLHIFTPISSTAFTTLLSFTLDCLTFSSRSTPLTMIFITSVLFIISYSGLTNVSSLLFFSTPISKSGLLLKLSTFPILLLGICLSIKSNLDRYRVYLACLLFNFCTFIKYLRFLWFIQILNLVVVPSRKCL